MADSRKLTGYPWHITYIKENKVRDKKKCVHFYKNVSKQNCCKIYKNCIDVDDCDRYREKRESCNHKKKNLSSQKKILPEPKKQVIDMKTGDKISHEKFGVGTVIAIKNNNLTIQFENSEYGKKILRYGVAPIEKI